MAAPLKGDVVVLPFPFSDLSNSKRRPALVLTPLKGDDVILCQITSRKSRDDYSLSLSDSDFTEGSLKLDSFVRPNRLFTADSGIILYRVGRLSPGKVDEILTAVCNLLQK